MATQINSMPLNSIPFQPETHPERGLSSIRVEDVRLVIEPIRREFLLLQQHQIAISKRIAVIKAAVIGLAQVFGSGVMDADLQELLFQPSHRPSRPHPGLTDLCRRSLRESPHPLTVPEILKQIRVTNSAALANHKSPRASLSVILRRLVDYNEVERVLTPEGLRAWTWISRRVEATNRNDSPSQ